MAKRIKRVYMKSVPGGIHDQMNCLMAFMRGYNYQEKVDTQERSEGYLTSDHCREQIKIGCYQRGSVQWQIGAIDDLLARWGMSTSEAFGLAEFLYAYCPSYNGSKDDYERLKLFG